MKNQNTILAERNKVTNGMRTYNYRFNFNDHNHTDVFTNNVFIDEKSGELIIENRLINSLIEQGYEYEMTEGAFKSTIPCEDKHRYENQIVKRVFPEDWDD